MNHTFTICVVHFHTLFHISFPLSIFLKIFCSRKCINFLVSSACVSEWVASNSIILKIERNTLVALWEYIYESYDHSISIVYFSHKISAFSPKFIIVILRKLNVDFSLFPRQRIRNSNDFSCFIPSFSTHSFLSYCWILSLSKGKSRTNQRWTEHIRLISNNSNWFIGWIWYQIW